MKRVFLSTLSGWISFWLELTADESNEEYIIAGEIGWYRIWNRRAPPEISLVCPFQYLHSQERGGGYFVHTTSTWVPVLGSQFLITTLYCYVHVLVYVGLSHLLVTKAISTLYTVADSSWASTKPYRIWLLFTHKTLISVTERSCAASILKVNHHVSDRFLRHSFWQPEQILES